MLGTGPGTLLFWRVGALDFGGLPAGFCPPVWALSGVAGRLFERRDQPFHGGHFEPFLLFPGGLLRRQILTFEPVLEA